LQIFNAGVCFQNQRTAKNGVASGDSFWTALAACRGEAQRRLERSGDSAFDETTPAGVLLPKRRRVSLAAAVQNICRPMSF
jgi:hypothetical protein